jgi:hypothetical protein
VNKQSHNQNWFLPSNQQGFLRGIMVLAVIIFSIFGLFNLRMTASAVSASAQPEITSTIEGYCLNDDNNGSDANASVSIARCNDSKPQNWQVNNGQVQHSGGDCLDVENNGQQISDVIVANRCTSAASQKWIISGAGLENVQSGYCLNVPESRPGAQLNLGNCNNLDNLNQGWGATHYSDFSIAGYDCKAGTEGQRIACVARQQWVLWQSGTISHSALLNRYSDGNGYEEWCADFVSYVYKTAGYPFTNGGRNNWDEYNANNIVNLNGLTYHAAGNYVPKPGDIAYFDYPGGHVEIVVQGGIRPTYIYGDAGTSDPTTQNGEMNEDMLTSDGSAGQVMYYMSPSS